MQASKQYRDGTFVNTYPSTAVTADAGRSKISTLVEFMLPGQGRRPERPLPMYDPRVTWAKTSDTGLRATWLGHSTVLLEMGSFRVLTDPVWARRASPFSFAGPARFQPVPVDIASLPPLDVVLISHDHYDHLDRSSVLMLAARGARFVTSLGVGLHLEAWGVPAERSIELDWWESTVLPGGLTITAAPAHHFSGRGLRDGNATLWSSFALRCDRGAVFFSGDTGLSAAFDDIGRRLGPFDLVMMEVGAFHPSWGAVHLGPENACKAWASIGSGQLLPIHWGTFDLATHAWFEPAEVLLARVPPAQLVMPCLGQPIEPSRVTAATPWWRDVAQPHHITPSDESPPSLVS
jgi:L-ascorbate metabolism protein UlaG (beta-lactamase superfamily)